jgi:hypothetical protein
MHAPRKSSDWERQPAFARTEEYTDPLGTAARLVAHQFDGVMDDCQGSGCVFWVPAFWIMPFS